MDTMKILLGATIALLLAAVVLSWQKMRHDSANVPPEELARVEAEIQQLKLEQQRLEAERELRTLRASAPVTTAPAITVPPSSQAGNAASASGDGAAQPDNTATSDLEKRLKEAEAKAAKLEREKNVYKDEAGLIEQRNLEKRDDGLRRARLIKQALLIATVKEYVENPDIGSFATIRIERPDNVQPGTILCIRRNTGILGKVKVGEMMGDEAIANPLPESFMGGPIDIRPGDELILPPPF